MTLWRAPAATFLLLSAVPQVAQAAQKEEPIPIEPRRLALVIGNDSYINQEALPGAKADADEVTQKLIKLGFDVTQPPARGSSTEFITLDLVPFAGKIGRGDLVVFYYSGHGFSYGGESYLVPTGVPKTVTRGQVYGYFPPESAIRAFLQEKQPGLTIMVFDACRSQGNFVTDEGGYGPSKGYGTLVRPPSNVWIAYASAPGYPAKAGVNGAMSVFTKEFAAHVEEEGAELSDLELNVNYAVGVSTNGDQIPWYSSTRVSKLWLRPDAAILAEERRLWIAARDTGTRRAVDQYLSRYAVGPYAEAARKWLASNPEPAPVVTTRISPLNAELSWLSATPRVKVNQFSGVSVGTSMVIESPQSIAQLRQDIGDNRLAYSSSVVLTRPASAERVASAGTLPDPTQLGTAKHTPVALKKGTILSNFVQGPSGMLRAEYDDARAYLVDAKATATTTIDLGSPKLQRELLPDSAGSGATVKAGAISALLAEAHRGNDRISWVAIGTQQAFTEREAADRGLLAADARKQLLDAGIPAGIVTTVENLPEQIDGVRLRVYTK